MIKVARRALPVVILAGSIGLSGCLAAAVPVMMAVSAAGVAASGFGLFKTVQTTTGGAVRIGFGSADEKDVPPPDPLPAGRKVAIWPGDEKEVKLAERLSGTGRFDVTSPSAVARTLASRDIPVDFRQLTASEQADGFQQVCRAHQVDLVLAAKDEGTSTSSNFFSFNRANITQTFSLSAYDCRSGQVGWRDRMAVVMEMGGQTPAAGEVATIAGEAWAERLLDAPQG